MIVFWVLMFLGRSELGWKGVSFSVALWAGLLLIFSFFGISPYVFIGVQALLDVVLVIVIFGGDITIR